MIEVGRSCLLLLIIDHGPTGAWTKKNLIQDGPVEAGRSLLFDETPSNCQNWTKGGLTINFYDLVVTQYT